jgi:flagellar biosynthesis protein FlhB
MSGDRTEKPTAKRREEARKRGQVARRPDLSAAIAFLAAIVIFKVTASDMWDHATNLFKRNFQYASSTEPLTPDMLQNILTDAVVSLTLLTAPIILVSMIAGIASSFAQGGLTLSADALKPKMERLNPVNNLKKAFGLNGIVELLKGVLKLAGIVGICYGVLTIGISDAATLVGTPPAEIFTRVGSLVYDIALRAGAVIFLISVLDYGYGWYQHEKSLKMTKQEIRDEYKQQEGDPMVKSRRRSAARAAIQRQLQSTVPMAHVVVTNPTHFAVALRYDREKDHAPIVVAKGADEIAKKIRELARDNDVSIIENPPLARTLYKKVDVGRAIPEELFKAVAELLAFVFRQRENPNRYR